MGIADAGLVVVHRAAPEVADAFADRLCEAGLDAVALDRPGFLVLLVTFGTYRVRIAVPAAEVAEARRLMADWDRESAPIVKDLTRQVRRQALIAALPAAVGALLVLFVGGLEPLPWFACFLPALYLVTFLALSLVQRGRRRSSGDRSE